MKEYLNEPRCIRGGALTRHTNPIYHIFAPHPRTNPVCVGRSGSFC